MDNTGQEIEQALVEKTIQQLWYLCDVLRDSRINYSEHLIELVQLLFIKLAHESNIPCQRAAVGQT